ncbi:MAG: M50 family metallopeptidase [Patescibacteria group bacterium]
MDIAIGFIIAIIVLVFVHELGHFLFAKWVGCRVDEFSVGFPPALFSRTLGETRYTLGAIPIGGYVKIWGENGSEEVQEDPDNPRALYNRPRWAQALVLFGGILFNVILAWLLFSILFATGIEANSERFPDERLANPKVQITGIIEGYPAASSTLSVASTINAIYAENGDSLSPIEGYQAVQAFIASHPHQVLSITTTNQAGEVLQTSLSPKSEGGRALIGVELATVGTITLPWYQALYEGARLTVDLTIAIFSFLGDFLAGLFTGSTQADSIAGPVGIAHFAGDSFSAGAGEFAWFIAILSLNLAIFNLLPIPALDGGRLVLVAIESVIRRPLNPRWALYLNAGGFIFLIGLMALVTIFDIYKLF